MLKNDDTNWSKVVRLVVLVSFCLKLDCKIKLKMLPDAEKDIHLYLPKFAICQGKLWTWIMQVHIAQNIQNRALEGVYAWNFIPGWNSSRNEIIPVCGEMSLTVDTFFPRWNFIPEWTHPCQKDRDEISSWNEKKKKRRGNTSSWDETLQWTYFYVIFDTSTQYAFQL